MMRQASQAAATAIATASDPEAEEGYQVLVKQRAEARQWVESEFAPEVVGRQWSRVLRRALEKHRGGG